MDINYTITLVKRLSIDQKEEIIKGFLNGQSLDFLAKNFGYTKLTISRHLKKFFGKEEFDNLIKGEKPLKNKKIDKTEKYKTNKNKNDSIPIEDFSQEENNSPLFDANYIKDDSFMEITPLNFDIDNEPRKDLSSVPIENAVLPKIVYMIVNKKIELETKLLKEYADWHFLPEEDLNSRTIEIYTDIKNAKRDCKKEQKVIKVPNTDVFKIVSRILVSRGITRIIKEEQLISL